MTYQNRKTSSVSVRLIIKTPKATTITNSKFGQIKDEELHGCIHGILKSIEEDLCLNLLVSSGDNDK